MMDSKPIRTQVRMAARVMSLHHPAPSVAVRGTAASTRPSCREGGIALLTSLLVLVMATMLAIAMFGGFGQQQKVAGNTLEKERSFQAAENALQFAEQAVVGNPSTGMPCSDANTVQGEADVRICAEPLANPRDPATWVGTGTYAPPAMMVGAGGVATNADGQRDINYTSMPGLHVAYLGLSPGGAETLYAITGSGYGGNASTTSVVQSVYAVRYKVRDLTNP